MSIYETCMQRLQPQQGQLRFDSPEADSVSPVAHKRRSRLQPLTLAAGNTTQSSAPTQLKPHNQHQTSGRQFACYDVIAA